MDENDGRLMETPVSSTPSASNGPKKRKADGQLEMPGEDMMTVPAARLFDVERSMQQLAELSVGAGTSSDAKTLEDHVKAIQKLIRDAKPLRKETLGLSKANAIKTAFTKPKWSASLVQYSDSESDGGGEESVRHVVIDVDEDDDPDELLRESMEFHRNYAELQKELAREFGPSKPFNAYRWLSGGLDEEAPEWDEYGVDEEARK